MHPSTAFHLRTETALLSTLYTRSRAQHRAQLFLRNMEEVLRLAKRVLAQLELEPFNNPSSAPTSRASSPKSSTPTPLAPLRPLIAKLLIALLSAGRATQRMLALAHFVPLQTLLAGIYGRLFAVAMYLAPMAGVDGARVVQGEVEGKGVEMGRDVAGMREGEMGEMGTIGEVLAREVVGDVGEKLERPRIDMAGGKRPAATNISSETKAREPGSKPEPKLASEPEAERQEESEIGTPARTRISTTEVSKKKKGEKGEKRDAVDDIFGVTKKVKKDKSREGTTRIPKERTADTNKVLPGSESPTKKRVKTDKGDKPLPASNSDTEPKPKKVKDTNKSKKDKAKKKRKDAMDDIFGF